MLFVFGIGPCCGHDHDSDISFHRHAYAIPYHNYNGRTGIIIIFPGGPRLRLKSSDARVITLVHDPYHDPVCTVMNDQNENGKS